MSERKQADSVLDKRRWIAFGVCALMLASAWVAVEMATTPAATLSVGPTTSSHPTSSVSPSCTVTVNKETKDNNAVQLAITAYGPESSVSSPVTICIGPGHFPEQLTIDNTVDLSLVGAGNASTILKPASASSNGPDLKSGGTVSALIGAWNDVGLSIDNLTLNGTLAGPALGLSCGTDFVGVYYGESSGGVAGSNVTGINTTSGCQGQNAVRVDNGYFTTDTVLDETFNFTNSTVSNYGKNGISCIGLGLNCKVNNDTVRTIPQGNGFDATNGVEFWDAVGAIQHNTIAGNVYLPGNIDGGSYFGPETTASGILILTTPSADNISGNDLAGDQYGITTLSSPAEIWNNLISGTLLGVASDYNFLDAFGPVNTVGTDFAGGNTIEDANVGMLGYDANVTYTGNTIGPSNVSIEDENDLNYVYTVEVNDNQAYADVSGALLGDVSSFQTGSGTVVPTGVFTVDDNTFTNTSAVDVQVVSFGTYVSGASATVDGNDFAGFSQGLAVVVAGSADVESNTATSPAISELGGIGIYVYSVAQTVDDNTATGYSAQTGPGWWPDSQDAGIFLQPQGAAVVKSNELTGDSIGIAVSSSSYGPFPAPSWPNVASPPVGPIAVSDNIVTESTAFGIAFELNQQTNAEVDTPTVTVETNTVDNTVTGAVGLMVDQGAYTITGNTFEGTSLSGSSGASQLAPGGTIDTASVQVLDSGDSGTVACLGSNSYVDTSVYTSILNVTTDPPWFATIIGCPALTAPGAPTVSATALDVNQTLTVSGSIPSTGVPPYSWQWYIQTNGGSYVATTQCSTNSGTDAAAGASVSCVIPANKLAAGSYYNFELDVTDSATVPVTQPSPPSPTVTVASALTAPGTPAVNRPALDVDQTLTVSGTIPFTGTSPYAWEWWVSEDGNPAVPATQCAHNSGTGATGGSTVNCIISGNKLAAGHQYTFSLGVTDSATSAESMGSPASNIVTVSSALGKASKPGVSATKLDLNQTLTVSSNLPTSGTGPYSWTWLVSVNDGADTNAVQCAPTSGSGSGGATEQCVIAPNTLTVGDSYNFRLSVTDSATASESSLTSESSTVFVKAALGTPGKPTVNHTTLVVSATLTVKGKIPTGGTGPYKWEWFVKVNGGAFQEATQCAAPTGSGASQGATETCTIAGGTLTVGDQYQFALKVTDSASAPESTGSALSKTVTVIA
jgi:hypothetical protein